MAILAALKLITRGHESAKSHRQGSCRPKVGSQTRFTSMPYDTEASALHAYCNRRSTSLAAVKLGNAMEPSSAA